VQTKCEREQRAAAVASGDVEAAAQAAAACQELKPYWSQIMVEEGLAQGELLQVGGSSATAVCVRVLLVAG